MIKRKAKGIARQEIRLQGEGISRGIAIGEAYFFSYTEVKIPDYSIPKSALQKEIKRFFTALENSRNELEMIKDRVAGEGASDAVDILEAQLQFFFDPTITGDISKGILEEGRNAEAIFQSAWQRYHARFQSLDDPFFQERFSDLQDVYRRVLRHLLGGTATDLEGIPKGAIVLAVDLAPSDTAGVQAAHIGAFVTEKGGSTSHAAIVARAKGIPYVANLDLRHVPRKLTGPSIVDGINGVLILNPTEETLTQYRQAQERVQCMQAAFKEQANHYSETFDGGFVRLSANLDDIRELPILRQQRDAGIGLYRSEYLFLSRSVFPTEEEQFISYRLILERMQGLPVVIRAFDIGGDKHPIEQSVWKELNPCLGCRAIRYLLREPEIFRTQLRAVLRASAYGEVSLLFPMISSLYELREVKAIIHDVKRELKKEGHAFSGNIRVGCMIEVPSAALIADLLMEECDFLSIGTNDLVQYALAVDRSNAAMSGHYVPTHLGVLRMLKFIISHANSKNVPICLCGEMAADPRLTPLLIGMGLQDLSVATRHIPIIKKVIRRTSVVEARKLADRALALKDSDEIMRLLIDEYRRTVPEDILYNSD